MKLLTVLFSCVCFLASSQSIDVYVENTNTEISGTTYSVTYQSDQQITIDLIMKNNTGTNQTWDLERILPSVQHWQDQTMSWYAFSNPIGGNDFVFQQTPSWITPIDIEVPQDDSVWLSLRYEAQSEGCDVYTYYILNNDVRVDSFNIEICKTVGIDELEGLEVELYPNPTDGTVMLHASQPIVSAHVYDLYGRGVLGNHVIHSSSTWELVLKEEAGTCWVEIELQSGRLVRRKIIII